MATTFTRGRFRKQRRFLLVMACALPSFCAQAAQSAAPTVAKAMEAPPSRSPVAVAMVVSYRYNDVLWENDRTAHRIYNRALEAREPPSGSGIDSWKKRVVWPFMDRQLRTGNHHSDHGEGVDFYNVAGGRGAGGLGIWYDNKLWTSRNYVSHRILRTDGKAADFEVTYAPWPVDVQRKVWETRRFTLPLGTHFTRMVSTLASDSADPLLVGIGIGKRPTGAEGELTVDRTRGLASWWGPQDAKHGRMAVAIRVDPAMLADVVQDADNHLVILKVTPGKPFVYYSGSAWSEGDGPFRDRAAWDRYAMEESVEFSVEKAAQ